MSVTVTDQANTVTVNESTSNVTILTGVGAVGPTGPTGPSGAPGYHGAFYSTVTQTNPSASATNVMTFNQTSSSSGVSIVSSSQLTVTYAGYYNVAFSAQLDKTDAGDDTVEIFLIHNGNQEAWSNTKVDLTKNNAKSVAAWNWIVQLAAGDYVQIGWYSADLDLRLYAESAATSPARPAIPSVIATVNQIQNV